MKTRRRREDEDGKMIQELLELMRRTNITVGELGVDAIGMVRPGVYFFDSELYYGTL